MSEKILLGTTRCSLDDLLKKTAGGYILCSCKSTLTTIEAIQSHWQAGHFDYPVYTTKEEVMAGMKKEATEIKRRSRSWIQKHMAVAELIAQSSKDPRRKVGCVAVDDDNIILATGYNGFPRFVNDTVLRLNDRTVKNLYMVHAEANCVASAARKGHALNGATLYVTYPACMSCAGLLIQAGIRFVIYKPVDLQSGPTPTADTLTGHARAKAMLREARVGVIDYSQIKLETEPQINV